MSSLQLWIYRTLCYKIFHTNTAVFSGMTLQLWKRFSTENAKPIFDKARPTPFAIHSQVDAELDQLVEQNIIERYWQIIYSYQKYVVINSHRGLCWNHFWVCWGATAISFLIFYRSLKKNIYMLKSFLGLLRYYSNFIPNV